MSKNATESQCCTTTSSNPSERIRWHWMTKASPSIQSGYQDTSTTNGTMQQTSWQRKQPGCGSSTRFHPSINCFLIPTSSSHLPIALRPYSPFMVRLPKSNKVYICICSWFLGGPFVPVPPEDQTDTDTNSLFFFCPSQWVFLLFFILYLLSFGFLFLFSLFCSYSIRILFVFAVLLFFSHVSFLFLSSFCCVACPCPTP